MMRGRLSTMNARRWRAIEVSRAWKMLLLRAVPNAWLWRWLFQGEVQAGASDMRSLVGHRALNDLAQYCFARDSCFDSDPLIMARREGRRDVFLRITNYLNLNENDVLKLMENDDDY